MEFICVWFESVGGWFYQTDKCETGGPFGSIGEASGAAMKHLGRGEADFDLIKATGDYYHFIASKRDDYDPTEDVGSLYDLYNPFGGPS